MPKSRLISYILATYNSYRVSQNYFWEQYQTAVQMPHFLKYRFCKIRRIATKMIKLFIYKAQKTSIFNVFIHAKYNFVWKNAQICHEKSTKNAENANWECKKNRPLVSTKPQVKCLATVIVSSIFGIYEFICYWLTNN